MAKDIPGKNDLTMGAGDELLLVRLVLRTGLRPQSQ